MLTGIKGILASKKGAFSLLVLAVTAAALFTGKIAGTEFVAALTIISGIYCASTAAVDMGYAGKAPKFPSLMPGGDNE